MRRSVCHSLKRQHAPLGQIDTDTLVYYSKAVRFSWDPTKARTNLRKHGIAFEEAATVFADPLALVVEDRVHPERCLITGQSLLTHMLVVVFTDFDTDLIRIISARHATRQERRRYEEDQEP